MTVYQLVESSSAQASGGNCQDNKASRLTWWTLVPFTEVRNCKNQILGHQLLDGKECGTAGPWQDLLSISRGGPCLKGVREWELYSAEGVCLACAQPRDFPAPRAPLRRSTGSSSIASLGPCIEPWLGGPRIAIGPPDLRSIWEISPITTTNLFF